MFFFEALLVGLVLPSPTQAFTPAASTVPTAATVYRVSNSGWDNENYLNSLDKDKDNQNEANDEYYRMSKYGRTEGQDRQQWLPQQTVFDVENDEWPDFDGGAGNINDNSEGPPAFLQDDPFQQQQQFNLQQQEGIPPYGQQQPQRVTPYEHQPQVSDAWAQQFPQNSQQQQQQQPQADAPDPYTQQMADKQQQYVQQQEPEQQQQQQQQKQQPSPGNSRDELPNDSIDGAVFTDAMKAKVKASHSVADESSGGGRLFREMMAKAQQQARLTQSQQSQPPTVDIPGNAMDLSVAEQAKLFRDIMAQRQHEQLQQQNRFGPSPAQQQQRQHEQEMQSYAQKQLPNYPYGEQSAKPQFLPPGTGFDGRKIGRNRDAYMISTTADVYFAQLKQDSSSRNMARINGDDTKANEVFGDPTIQDITLAVNPYQMEARLKERDVLETIPEEALLFQDYGNKPPPDRHSSGISYKEKFEQAQRDKANHNGNGGNGNANSNNSNNNPGNPSFPPPTGGGQPW